jgi:DNA-binding transcriptional MocR family regulator
LAAGLAKTAEDTYINASYLNQAIVYEFIAKGWLEPNLANLRGIYEPRLYATLAALDEHFSELATWWKPDGGFFVGVNLNFTISADELLKKAAEANLALTDGRGFFPNRDVESFIRLPFCALTPREIQAGIARLADVLRGMR